MRLFRRGNRKKSTHRTPLIWRPQAPEQERETLWSWHLDVETCRDNLMSTIKITYKRPGALVGYLAQDNILSITLITKYNCLCCSYLYLQQMCKLNCVQKWDTRFSWLSVSNRDTNCESVVQKHNTQFETLNTLWNSSSMVLPVGAAQSYYPCSISSNNSDMDEHPKYFFKYPNDSNLSGLLQFKTWNGQVVVHGDYSSIANCQTEISCYILKEIWNFSQYSRAPVSSDSVFAIWKN
jgi:hypothetical protein